MIAQKPYGSRNFDFDAVAAHGTSYNYAQSAVVNIKPER